MKASELLRNPETGELIINNTLDQYQAEVVAEIDLLLANRPGWELSEDGLNWIYKKEVNDINKITWVCRCLKAHDSTILYGGKYKRLGEEPVVYERIKEIAATGLLA